MVTDSFLALACAGLIAFLFGLSLCFGGYRLFLFLLPIWGFFFGMWLGAESLQALFGVGFLATVTSWVVGFLVGAVFAVLSYLFYVFAVALVAGSLGYYLGVGLMQAIGIEMGFLAWVVGIVVALVLIAVTFRFNLQKWLIIIATSLLGAGIIFGSFYVMFNPWAQLQKNPIRSFLQSEPLLMILALVLAAFGIYSQYRSNRRFELEAYNRWEESM
jgi:hypothetical protein